MKKIISSIILAAILTVSFASCSSDDNSTSSNESGTSSNTSQPTSDQSDGSKDDTSSTDETNKNSFDDFVIPGTASKRLKTALPAFYEKMKADKYNLTLENEFYDGEDTANNIVSTSTIVKSGTSITSTSTSEGKAIVKDNKVYVVSDTDKTVTYADTEEGFAESYSLYISSLFYSPNLEYKNEGKEKLGSAEYEYDEYLIPSDATESSSSEEQSEEIIRYYFDKDNNFVGTKLIIDGQYYSIYIKSITDKIPDGEFDYPSDYKMIDGTAQSSNSSDNTSKAESEGSSSQAASSSQESKKS